MRLSTLAIALATVATVPAAYAAELATTTDLKTLSEELAVEEQKITEEIKTLEAELGTYETTTDGTITRTVDDGSSEPTGTTTDGTATRTIDDGSTETTTPVDGSTEPNDTTDDKTLTTTITEPCPMQAMVMCNDETHDTITREVEGCGTYYDCVPKETAEPSLCIGAEDLSSDTTICQRHLDVDGDCYAFRCATVDPPPPTYCDGSVEDPTSCPAGVSETHDGANGCILMQCVEKTCDRLTAYSLVEDCPMGSSLHFVEETCSYECQECEAKCPYEAHEMKFTTINSCDVMCSCPAASCPTGQLLVSREADCSINCQTPCTPPTCADGEYLVKIDADADSCNYECQKVRIKRNGGGGGKKTTTDGDGTTTKPCRGKNCRRKNLRA